MPVYRRMKTPYTKRVKRVSILFFLVLIPVFGQAQSYRFFNYGVPDGLCDNFTYTINQDTHGFLWIGTTQGLCRFDGRTFDQAFKGDTVPVSIALSSLLDSKGRLWFGHENGMISILEDGVFRLLNPGGELMSPVQAIREDSLGNILVLCQQSGIHMFSPQLELLYNGDPSSENDPFAGKFLYNFQITTQGYLLVGSNDGLSIYRYDPDLETYILAGDIPGLSYIPVKEIVPAVRPGEFWGGTEDEGVFSITGEGFDPEGYSVKKIGQEQGLEFARVSSIVFNGGHRVWITDNGTGLYRIELDDQGNMKGSVLFNTSNGLPDAYINQVFIDEEGNQWFSSPGNGIAVLRDQAFTFFDLWKDEQSRDVSSVWTGDTESWFGGRGRIGHVLGTHMKEMTYLGPEQGVPDDMITALYMDTHGDLYIGTDHMGLHVKRYGSDRIEPLFIARNSLENAINAIDGNGDSLFVATNNGVFTYTPATGKRYSFSTVNGLPHNKINDVMVDHEGRAWIATALHGVVSLPTKYLDPPEKQFLIQNTPRMEIVTLAEDDRGVLWAGTDGDGIFSFTDDTLKWYSTQNGLKSDFTYALIEDPNGFIWVGHREGLSRISPKDGHIRIYGKESGFTADVRKNAASISLDGRIMFGTTDGIIQYDAFQAREDTVPPRLSLKSVVISDTPYDPSHEIKLKFDRYRMRFDFVGINLSNPDQVTYQYKMAGYQEDWSDVSDIPWAFFPRVEDGDYTFMLRACDGNGNCTTKPLTLHISVKIPIWKAWWFIITLILFALATIFIIFKIRERNQKAIQEYLQRQLDERTREVVMQKEEIEIKNRDITDSINYAQRIQASILPPIKKLHEAFSGSFVFYQPRDIVSGDFYWYEKVDDHKFIVVCADSTGHGVPGAFMSMIGTTLIKDICLRAGIQKPSEVLATLDKEVRESLNQNTESSGSNDGMDIIVAEVDVETFKFTVSSAMRPVIIYSGDEQIYVKGSRSSVGGQLDENRTEKDFYDQEFQLKKGDIIYMFSDGYPDQFGGPLGRKFKMVRLKNLLRDIHDKPMDEQYNYIKSNFFLWKEDMDQVDDVLFMGIKL
jgi:ligand-binding sensor domain-containing protein/serine phosphatase RsbU (regulator of sigma subunit)